MKRRDLRKHLALHGCELLREGAAHSVFVHRQNRKSSTVPRHREVDEYLVRKICKDLDIAPPGKG